MLNVNHVDHGNCNMYIYFGLHRNDVCVYVFNIQLLSYLQVCTAHLLQNIFWKHTDIYVTLQVESWIRLIHLYNLCVYMCMWLIRAVDILLVTLCIMCDYIYTHVYFHIFILSPFFVQKETYPYIFQPIIIFTKPL